jgi:hypothetical protein
METEVLAMSPKPHAALQMLAIAMAIVALCALPAAPDGTSLTSISIATID